MGGVPVRGSLSRRVSMRGVSVRETPLPPYSYMWVVHILLECILVAVFYWWLVRVTLVVA